MLPSAASLRRRLIPLWLLAVALLVAAGPAPATADGSHEHPTSTTEEVSFTSDGLTLHGTVLVPGRARVHETPTSPRRGR